MATCTYIVPMSPSPNNLPRPSRRARVGCLITLCGVWVILVSMVAGVAGQCTVPLPTNAFSRGSCTNPILPNSRCDIVCSASYPKKAPMLTTCAASGGTLTPQTCTQCPIGSAMLKQPIQPVAADVIKGPGPGGYGLSNALSENGLTAVVGEFTSQSYYQGAVHVYQRAKIEDLWSPATILSSNDGVYAASEGRSVALNAAGTQVAWWAPPEAAAYVSSFVSGSWSTPVKVAPALPTTAFDDYSPAVSGVAIALNGVGDYMLLGARFDLAKVGSATIFRRISGVWTVVQRLTPPEAPSSMAAVGSSQFGYMVAMSNAADVLVIGGRFDGIDGAAWIFVWNSSTSQYVCMHKFVGEGGREWGHSASTSADGSIIAIGGSSGQVRVFARTSGTNTWVQRHSITDDMLDRLGLQYAWRLGVGVDLNADASILMITCLGDNDFRGAAVFLALTTTSWSLMGAKVAEPGAAANTIMGMAASIAANAPVAIMSGHGDFSFVTMRLADQCTTCTNVTYSSTVNAIECKTCEAGSYCSNGIKTTCPKNSYCHAQVTLPTVCPQSKQTIGTGSTDVTDCACPIGFALVSGVCTACSGTTFSSAVDSTSCQSCTPGSACSGGIRTACTGTSWSDASASVCTAMCPAGSYCSNGIKTTCPKNSYCHAQVTLPTVCPQSKQTIGTGSTDVTDCACPIGFALVSGVCTACSGTTFSSAVDSTSCQSCTPGSACSGGIRTACTGTSWSDASASVCTAMCPAGSYCSNGIKTTCPKNSYCHAQVTLPTVCPQSKQTIGTGSTDVTDCACPIGFALVSGVCTACSGTTFSSAVDSTSCQSCTPGSACSGGIRTACTGTSWSDASASVCTAMCPAGSYCSNGIKTTCPKNSYCHAQVTLPTVCPQSKQTIGTGSTDVTDCACPIGFALVSGVCTACSGTTFSSAVDSTSCQSCTPGSACSGGIRTACTGTSWSDASASVCTAMCPAGSYCSNGIKTTCPKNSYCHAQVTLPTVCPQSKQTIGTGSTDVTDCACPIGFALVSGVCTACSGTTFSSAVDSTSCQSCTPGSACSGGIRTACTGTSWSDASASVCTAMCPAGSYCSNGIKTTCPKNSYCHAQVTLPTVCPQSKQTIGTGSTDVTDCACPIGFALVSGVCTACSGTTFSSAVDSTSCQSCTPGSACSGGIRTACTGTSWSDASASVCTAMCPAGSYCSNGIKTTCPKNSYCHAQVTLPTVCPQSKQTIGTGSTDVTDCACPIGFALVSGVCTACSGTTFSSAVDSTSCQSCTPGSACSGGIRTACTGTSWSDASASVCTAMCPAGSYCSNGIKTTCPKNSYCHAQVTLPTVCPQSKQTIGTGSTDVTDCACPIGFALVSGVCTACSGTTFSSAVDSTSCQSCTPGSACSGGIRTACTGTSWSDASASVCTAMCPAGSYCVDGVRIDCPKDFYCLEDVSSATACPLATPSTSSTGAISVTDCQIRVIPTASSSSSSSSSTAESSSSSSSSGGSSSSISDGNVIISSSSSTGDSFDADDQSGSSAALSIGAIIGIAIGGFFLLLLLLLLYLLKRKRDSTKQKSMSRLAAGPSTVQLAEDGHNPHLHPRYQTNAADDGIAAGSDSAGTV